MVMTMSRASMRGRRWQALAAEVRDRDGHACQQCSATEDLTVDHVRPVAAMTADEIAAGAAYEPSNLRTLCRSCNARKGDRTPAPVSWFNRRFF